MNELVKIEESTLLQAFSNEDGLNNVIEDVKLVVDNFEHDLSTQAARKRTASLAHKVSKLKTRLDSMGKDLVGDWKRKAKAVDSNRKRMRDELDTIRDQARQPLTDWENIEAERVKSHREAVEWFSLDQHYESGMCAEKIQWLIDEIKSHCIDDNYEEFEAEAHRLKESTLAKLYELLVKEKEHEKKEAELERLIKEKEEQEKREYEERLKREAAEKARLEAEGAARKERERIEREKIEAETRAKLEKERAERSERDRIAAIERAKIEAEQAEKRRIEALEKAKVEAQQAAERARQKEMQRQKDEEERLRREQEIREANKRHVGRIRREAKEALMSSCCISEADARRVVLAIDSKQIAHISITY